MKLSFHYWRSYGKDRYYPDSASAKLIVEQIAGRKCLEKFEVDLLRALGFEVEVSTDEFRDEARRRV